jgi:lipoprotein NlpD
MITKGVRSSARHVECERNVTGVRGRAVLFSMLMFGLVLTLSACGGSRIYVPGIGESEQGKLGAGIHVVQHGETLYAIAFRYGLDYKGLAAANRIRAPYTIFVNQRIKLTTTTAKAPRNVASKRQENSSKAKVIVAKKQAPTKSSESNLQWRWPVAGKVISGFSLAGKVNKGVDIRGRLGESVFAAADGIVVYAGGGLRGYGKLVIVKHNDKFLSAYGHNRAILVKEGEKVKGGQAVAEIGASNSNQEMLHFEIRRNGKPENPLLYLPARL